MKDTSLINNFKGVKKEVAKKQGGKKESKKKSGGSPKGLSSSMAMGLESKGTGIGTSKKEKDGGCGGC